jgi:hydrogenase maturation protease
MHARVLIAGVGNVCFGDDGFGVEVARRMRHGSLPPGVSAIDFGVRGLALAQALVEPHELLIVVAITTRGGEPGSLYVLDAPNGARGVTTESCSLDLPLVLAAVRAFGGRVPRVRIVGCEPADLGARMGLSDAVRRAVAPAVELARELALAEVG